ncbi:basement membrane-specific heparan sulfate proteoglycan core protein-like [Brienomyrus brachyistius]|uniref:basement membrane-specific heparan sulfate proteoglycan core protein-like n=1 Tax=Brienomyrus brachyistius TaxID=42636 RepID=UPI0020B2EF07|nr:basement membrane-specific heparan sulfate proteoglycan core protein-like [Brienomyrus brachyistius]
MAIYIAAVLLSVLLSAAGQQAPAVSIEPQSATVRQGESTSFHCQVLGGSQPVRLEWKRTNNQPLPDNVKTGPGGSVLTIANARPGNQGTYRCIATNAAGKTHSTASLTVKRKYRHSRSTNGLFTLIFASSLMPTDPPKVRVTPGGAVRVTVGETVNLECQASGRPRPSVSWFRLNHGDETVLSSSAATDTPVVMQVSSARLEDAGVYLCRAQSSEGSSEARVELTVEGGTYEATPPLASVVPAELVAVEGQSVTFHCHVSGSPTPTISWSKLRAPLPWLHKAQGGTLVLQNVGRQDSGQYICNATNAAGFVEATAQMEVETPPYATCLPEQLRVRAGDPIHLQCLAHGTTPLRFLWSKVGGSLPRRAEIRDNSLLIGQSRTADAGTYKCVVTNKHGSSEATAKVTVR